MKKTEKKNGTVLNSNGKTLLGFLSWTAVLLLAIVLVFKLFLLPYVAEKLKPETRAAASNSSADCWSVNVQIPEVIPLCLKNSMRYKNYLYWLKVNIDNRCEDPLHLKVSFEFRQNPNDRIAEFDPDLNTLDFVLPPHSQFGRKYAPVITSLNNDLEADLLANWRLEDNRNNLLSTGSDTIHILPKNRIKWDLAMPDKPVPINYLLASTAAWTVQPEPVVRNMASGIFHSIDQRVGNGEVSVFASTWVARCYLRFFQDLRKVIPDEDVWSSFPPKVQEAIRLPSEVINGGHFDPVETAVFLSALTNAAGVQDRIKTALVSGKFEKKFASRVFLFAWRANTSKANWSAIDIRWGPELSFQENRQGATALLHRIFSDQPTLAKALWHKGVFLGGKENIVAIDFARAATIYHIAELP